MMNRLVVAALGAMAVLGALGAGAVTLIPPRTAEDEVAGTATTATTATSNDRADILGSLNADSESVFQPSRGPVIPETLRIHSDFIIDRWADGPNLSTNYVQITVPCGRDCFNLIIGDTVTGDIYESGMGFGDMPDLSADSRADSDLLLLTWLNESGGNCKRAIYRWDGQTLGAVSDVLEYSYTDAGCAQFELAHVMGDMD